MSKVIPLTKGYEAIVDDIDYERVNKLSWYAAFAHKNDAFPRAVSQIKQKRIYLHRFILNASPDSIVDHVDGNPLNNKKSNLRFCNKSGNALNAGARKRNKTGYRGIYKTPLSKKNPYIARITIEKKLYHIGCFPTLESAIAAYNKFLLESNNPFIRLLKS